MKNIIIHTDGFFYLYSATVKKKYSGKTADGVPIKEKESISLKFIRKISIDLETAKQLYPGIQIFHNTAGKLIKTSS